MANCTTYLYDDSRLGCALPSGHDGPHVTGSGRGWHDSDDMDGGVTAALIEKEAERNVQTSFPSPAKGMRYQRERDEARAMAALWKETARRAVQTQKTYVQAAKDLLRARRVSEQETRRLLRRANDAEQERDEARARADAAEPRPLSPREHLAALWETAYRPVNGRIPAGTAIITRSDYGNGDVRYRTLEATGRDLPDEGRTLERNYPYGPENGEEYRLLVPPARPEGAEDIEALLDGFGVDTLEMQIELADFLASRGVRVATEDGGA